MHPSDYVVSGAGLGLRRENLDDFAENSDLAVDFVEVAPENWIPQSPQLKKRLADATANYPLVAHGLSLSIGSPDPLDEWFISQIKQFMDDFSVRIYTEHLTYCSSDGHVYDLLPIPFTEDAVNYVAERVMRVQDILQEQIALENASFYVMPPSEMTELDFVTQVLEKADCKLLLDVNNVYVNSVNHGYDPKAYLDGLPTERIAYGHIAGHLQETDDLIIDTHGADVIDKVWDLLGYAYQSHGVFPTLLERDFNLPPMQEMLNEVARISSIQRNAKEGK